MIHVPKSPEECKKELLETFGMIFAAGGEGRVMPSEEAISVVKSSLASLLMHAEGKMMDVYSNPDGYGDLGNINDTVDGCRSVLRRMAEEITKE